MYEVVTLDSLLKYAPSRSEDRAQCSEYSGKLPATPWGGAGAPGPCGGRLACPLAGNRHSVAFRAYTLSRPEVRLWNTNLKRKGAV